MDSAKIATILISMMGVIKRDLLQILEPRNARTFVLKVDYKVIIYFSFFLYSNQMVQN